MPKKTTDPLAVVRQFVERELQRRQASGMKRYIREAQLAMTAVTKLYSQRNDYNDLCSAVEEVHDWDSLHGYGADDDGYNRLSQLYGYEKTGTGSLEPTEPCPKCGRRTRISLAFIDYDSGETGGPSYYCSAHCRETHL